MIGKTFMHLKASLFDHHHSLHHITSVFVPFPDPELSLLCSLRLHLFDKIYSKNRNSVKYDYNFKM